VNTLNVRTETVPCPLGCTPGEDQVTVGHDRLCGGPGQFPVVRCRACGLMRTNPRPDATSLHAYYPDDYAPYETSAVAIGVPAPRRPWLLRILQRLVDSRSQWLPTLVPGKMLEFGCASGGFLAKMRARGWSVEGVDISPVATACAREHGLAVHTGTLDSLPVEAGTFDLVVGWMALEHLPDPVEALRFLHGRTRPGGWLVISIPNAAAFEFRIFGRYWYALQVPAHLFHFTPTTMNNLLLAAGWRPQGVFHHRSAANLVGSLGHLLEDSGCQKIGAALVRGVSRSPALHALMWPLALVLGLLRQSGRMTVWARKSDA